MNANEVLLWLLVAALAFLIGQGRISLRGAPALSDSAPDVPPGVWSREAADLLRSYRRHTLTRLATCYNLDELRTLAFDVGLKHDEIAGDTPSTYARELLEYVEGRGMLQYLLAGMR